MAVNAGSAVLDVIPGLDTFNRRLRAGIDPALKKAGGSVKVDPDTKGFGRKLEADTLPHISKLGGQIQGLLSQQLGAPAAAAFGSLNKIPGALRNIGGEGAALSGVLKGGVVVGAAAAATALVAMASAGIDKFVSAGAEVRKFKATLGSTAEEASGFRNVAKALGIDTDAMGKSLQKLATNLFNTGGEFAGLKVEVAQNKDGSANLVGTIESLRATYQSIEDPLQKAAFLQQAVGKGGMEVRAALSLTNAEWEKFKNQGPILSDKDLADTKAYSLAQRELGVATSELQINLGKGLVPVLTQVTAGVTELVNATDRISSPVGGLAGIAKWASQAVLHATPLGNILDAASLGADKSEDSASAAAAAYAKQAAQAQALGVALTASDNAEMGMTETTKKAIEAAQQHADKISGLAGNLAAGFSVYGDYVTRTDVLSEHNRQMAESFDRSSTAASSLKTGLDILIGVHVSSTQSIIAYEAKVDALTESFAQNGTNLNINTAEGRTNYTAILDLINGTTNLAAAMTNEGATTEHVTRKFNEHVSELRSVMLQAGFTEEQVAALIERYHLTPDSVNTQINTPGMGEARENIRGIGADIGALDGRKATVNVEAVIGTVGGALGSVFRAMGGPIPGHGTGDTVPAMLTPGEFVWSVPAVQNFGGLGAMEAAHRAAVRGYASGGAVSVYANGPGSGARGSWIGSINDIIEKKGRDAGEQYARDHPLASLGGSANGLNPEFLSRFQAWNASLGNILSITSGFRSSAEQAVLYARYLNGTGNLAAVPGSSMHEKGLAIDHSPASWAMDASAGAFGLTHPVSGEPWHVEPMHTGGIVGGLPGEESLKLLEAGERVTPAGADGIDYVRLGDEVARALRQSPPVVEVQAIAQGMHQRGKALGLL